VVPAREGLRQEESCSIVGWCGEIGEVVPAREGLRHVLTSHLRGVQLIGEVVPAREGLRPHSE